MNSFDPAWKEGTSADAGSTETAVKEVTQELLRCGYVEEQRKPEMFRRTITKASEISAALEPLDLALRLDEHRGVAFLVVAEAAYIRDSEGAEWAHPLVRRQRLTLEQSLLVALLRQMFVLHEQESGVGGPPAKVAVDELLPQFLSYLGDSGSDANNQSRLSTLLDQLKTYGIVSEVDKNEEFTIRPLIAHLANPDSLKALLGALEAESAKADSENAEA
jgi:hypothetical protein